jgi:uncharacterized membrane protein YdjX (TVP38/TMEM64 family)
MDLAPLPGADQKAVVAKRLLVAVCLAIVVIFGLTFFILTADQRALSEVWVRGLVGDLGVFGPLALIGLMVLAIIISPIPSGPIAVAAGALYGTLWGGIITTAGALLGAVIAFGAARYLGFDAIRRSENVVLKYLARPRSQVALMLIVFAARLIPFISFDMVSYGAGITCLSFGRFALATALGVVPVCFALAAMGSGLADGGTNWMWIVGLGGAITLTPILGNWIWNKTRRRR